MQGRSISEVQQFGLFLLHREDNMAKNKSEMDALRYAMVSSGTSTVADLFPEIVGAVKEYEEAVGEIPDLDDPNADYDYSGVEWQSLSELPADERDALEEFLAQDLTERVPTPDVPLTSEEWS